MANVLVPGLWKYGMLANTFHKEPGSPPSSYQPAWDDCKSSTPSQLLLDDFRLNGAPDLSIIVASYGIDPEPTASFSRYNAFVGFDISGYAAVETKVYLRGIDKRNSNGANNLKCYSSARDPEFLAKADYPGPSGDYTAPESYNFSSFNDSGFNEFTISAAWMSWAKTTQNNRLSLCLVDEPVASYPAIDPLIKQLHYVFTFVDAYASLTLEGGDTFFFD